MLILEAGFGQISWWIINASLTAKSGRVSYQQAEIPDGILELMDGVDTIAYVLHNGGDAFPDPVTHLAMDMLALLERTIPLFPFANRMMYSLAQAGLSRRPEIKHLVFCETAFFRNMPEKASAFALPYSFFEKGIRRYGGDGLFHQWAWEEASRRSSRLQRMVSVHLGDHPNTAVLLDGHAVETSLGFSPLDGIPSARGCGEIDPGIVLLLAKEGMPIEAIEHMLAVESGLNALTGRPDHWVEVASSPDMQTHQVRQLLLNQIVKAIGSGLAVLGGVDAIWFGCEDIIPWLGFVEDICHRLEFAGVIPVAAYEDQDCWRLSGKNSRIQVSGIIYPRPHALAKLIDRSMA